MLIYSGSEQETKQTTLIKVCIFRRKISKIFTACLGNILPRKTKRLIFISTFIACANEVTNPSKLLLTRINELLHVSNIDEAIALPMLFGCKMWKHKFPDGLHFDHLQNPKIKLSEFKNKDLNSAELRITANTILSELPKWLMYDSKRVMRADVVALISALPQLSSIR